MFHPQLQFGELFKKIQISFVVTWKKEVGILDSINIDKFYRICTDWFCLLESADTESLKSTFACKKRSDSEFSSVFFFVAS